MSSKTRYVIQCHHPDSEIEWVDRDGAATLTEARARLAAEQKHFGVFAESARQHAIHV